VDEGMYAAVLTADEELLDRLLATLAAVGLEPQVVSDPGALRSSWRDATVVAVGGDRAEELAALSLPRRSDVFVVGSDADGEELCRWSVPLGAAVAPLPSAESWFVAALADAAGTRRGDGRLVAVVGASGGVGASTCAAALAVASAARGQRTMLVDGDPWGGGLDLLLGAEHAEGWRWPRLANARGHLGDLTGQLPYVDGVDLLAAARRTTPRRAAEIGSEQLASVLGSATRSHDLTVVDLPRWLGPVGQETVRRAALTLLVARADLRGLAAARELVPWLPQNDCHVLLRERRSAAVSHDLVEESLGLPVIGTALDEHAVRLAAERGEPPNRSPRSALARACLAVLDQLPARPAVA
jgi:secretion/DNA translocation related CpaE-like protein